MLPNFLFAGVAKAGTTSLYYYLLQHPEIDIPRKETFYFAKDFYKNAPGAEPPFFREKSRIIFGEEDYDKFYKRCQKKAIGEISTCYSYFYKSSIPLIKEKLGDVKILFLLRNPVERAFSAYKHFKRLRSEPFAFKEALQDEKSRMKKHWDFMWYYSDVGFYAKQVKVFKENFSQVKVFLTEDLYENPLHVMKQIFQFIGVDDSFVPDTSFRYNISDTEQELFRSDLIKKNPIVEKLIKPVLKKIIPEKKRFAIKQKLRKQLQEPEIILDDEMKNHLENLYRQDILELEKIIDRDLSKWLR